jgi:hypothetical protein
MRNGTDLERPPLDHGTRANFEEQVRVFFVKLIHQKISGFIQPRWPVDEIMRIAGHKVH